MRLQTPPRLLSTLLLTYYGLAVRGQGLYYTDIHTTIRFYGHGEPGGYLFGMVTPRRPTTDFVAQLVAPLNHSDGWGGVSLGDSMTGPLLLVTWANGSNVMTAARMADAHSAASVVPYTAGPITVSPIKAGTFANSTHVSSTFLCKGCINSDSFDPGRAGEEGRHVFFGYAYSRTAVDDPSDIDTALSDHTGRGGAYGGFRVALDRVKSDAYHHYAGMAESAIYSVKPEAPPHRLAPTTTSTSAPSPGSTSAAPAAPTDEWGNGCYEDECEMPTGPDYSHREISWLELFGLVALVVIYLLQPFIN
ncbi:uncharacterized protein P884DRAFT_197807 [Thermothelomyces heterothallicus CBS 202.75]|uniref:uncharacterized protein n=1 Tax=Thermothelomyces heterothallicus CBS 202.75 TaxID=1149848 RepID=UPI0037424C5F